MNHLELHSVSSTRGDRLGLCPFPKDGLNLAADIDIVHSRDGVDTVWTNERSHQPMKGWSISHDPRRESYARERVVVASLDGIEEVSEVRKGLEKAVDGRELA